MNKIEGVKIIQLKKICDERGMILHMLKSSDEHYLKFGEIYFSCGFPKLSKHGIFKKMTLNNCCIVGMMWLVYMILDQILQLMAI